ncbi:NAD-P-binding protein [Auriscalpium vulgare]|uniref:NAD-P-binding protein n=1 Tax=Auriscalpium vulgare TaxID=40419 RepID=A0ACB8RC18_9AGAM|nr:NAD-P-binding protein [Auriscalpium vulgare]
MSMPIGFDEALQVTLHHDIYPTIDPTALFEQQSFSGKVVLITGASRGIGRETALYYARAGASLVLVGRQQSTLDDSKAVVLKAVPSARVLVCVADVADVERAGEIVAETVKTFGKLDVLVANAGTVRAIDGVFTSKDPSGWWNVFEVNVRGVYNFVHFSIPELLKTKGKILIVTSQGAQHRFPAASDYLSSKHALGRIAELIALEFPAIKVFNVDPGCIDTQLLKDAKAAPPGVDTVGLPAATFLYLTSGKADYLSGRYFSANWDLAEVERDYKAKILAQNGLVSKLYIPQ